MDYNSLKDIFTQQEGVFFYVQDNFWHFMGMLALTFLAFASCSLLVFAMYELTRSKIVLSVMALFSIALPVFLFNSMLDSYNSFAEISEVKAAATENIENKLKMDNISDLSFKISKSDVVSATAKYTNMDNRTTADLTIGFEDSGEPFILTSEFVTPEFIKTIEK